MSLFLDQVSDVLLPRRYQEEIFVRAQQGNVIAVLDTGSGKTYISTLLIRSVAAQTAGQGKIMVFLVPKVALVQQQGEFIARQTSLRVRQFSGATAHEMSNRAGWKNEFDNADVFVMTAQIFLNVLTHSHWSMNKVSLVVFDECHHARKNHPYVGIMREYFQLPFDARPKIFGMTASPIWNPKNAAESLGTLEKNLDGKVVAVKEHAVELIDHAPRPEESFEKGMPLRKQLSSVNNASVTDQDFKILKLYPAPPASYPEYPLQSLRLKLGLESLPREISIPVDKILTRYEVTYYSLGPYGADYYLYSEVKQRVAQLTQDAVELAMGILPPDQYAQAAAGYPIIGLEGTLHPKLKHLETTLKEFQSFFEPEDGGRSIPFSWCTPKVKQLVEILFGRYTTTFQGIVFVEQRHIARSLAAILPRTPLLEHLIKCDQLVGHGTVNSTKTFVKGMGVRNQQDTVKMFRAKELNLLIATSVAEEGLDFPACDLVIRFDPVQHMVGYLQSRGRARHKSSTFIIMAQEGAQAQAERYLEFSQREPELKKIYQERDLQEEEPQDEDEEDTADPGDVAQRERYVVPSTGAVLTYHSSISLINQLCSLIPRDRFTPMHVPQFSGDFTATIQLPSSLPLPSHLLEFQGPTKKTRKEAKRAVAFLAVKRLHALGVFDDYLLPATSTRTSQLEDSDGVPIANVTSISQTLDVLVRDPWTPGPTLWLHVLRVDGVPTAGVVTGTSLPPVDLVAKGAFLSTDDGVEVVLHPQHAWSQRRAMEDYTRMGIWWCITGRGITLPLTCYLLPITQDLKIDFDAIQLAIEYKFGSWNWEGIGEDHCGHLMYVNSKEFGHPLLLHKLRPDITPSSIPPPGSKESEFPTYRAYWMKKYTRMGRTPAISFDGPCVEGLILTRSVSSSYSLENNPIPTKTSEDKGTVIFPIEFCRWIVIPEHMWRAFLVLPALQHRMTDVYRAHQIRFALSLPPIHNDLLVQAITLPSANAGFNNQRLETFGDAVLKFCAVVHLYIRFPHRHEGQLDNMKRIAIANRTLLARGLERNLQCFLTSETQSLRQWRYVLVPSEGDARWALRPRRVAPRRIVRRSLQDCMEAILGASFAVGGINMALHAGTALGLSFGGTMPWNVRVSPPPCLPVVPLFIELQEKIGYKFQHGGLLLEAITHPSFRSTECSSYQRLEFLGDAFVDMVVTDYLYRKFPHATSGQLTWARSRAVCSPAFACVAVRKLSLHKLLLMNNVELSMAISNYVPILEALSEEEVVLHGWKQDPPKAISDIFESIMGALFVDCHYNYEKAAAIAEIVLEDLLAVLHPDLPKDPMSELMIWVAQSGCRCVSFAKSQSRPEVRRSDCMSVLVHGITVAGPTAARNLPLAKGLAAEAARSTLSSPESPHFLPRLCTCAKRGAAKAARKAAKLAAQEAADEEEATRAVEEALRGMDVDDDGDGEEETLSLDMPRKEELDDETNEGFAILARVFLDEAEGRGQEENSEDETDGDAYFNEELADEEEIERMMKVD